jgi:hypothetical protein
MERESETVTAEESSGVEGGLEATAAWRVAWKQRRREVAWRLSERVERPIWGFRAA